MKKIYIISILFAITFLSTCLFAQTKKYRIGVLVWHKTVHDEDALIGLLKGIELSRLPADLNIRRVDGNEAETRRILSAWQKDNVDLICIVGTKAAIIALEEIQDIPIVFTAVTNPVASGISKSWDGSGRNVTGSSNWIDSEILLNTFKQTIPYLKSLGVIYDPNNPVPLAELIEAEKKCGALGITLKQAHIKNPDEIENSIETLISKGIDALWIPREVLVYKNMGRVGKITEPKKLPVVSSTVQGVGLDEPADNAVGIVAMTVDYQALGRLCVPDIIEILKKGKSPGDIPIRQMSNYQTVINMNAADTINYEIPMATLAEANIVIRGFSGRKIVVAGTGDSQELLQAIAKALEEKLGSGEIEIPDSIGSSGGVRALIDGQTDIARVARPLKKDEEQAGLTYRLFAEAPVVFVTHPDVIGIDNITTEEIIQIYSGRINNWNEFGYQVGKIYPINRESGDSCLRILNEKIPGFTDIPNLAGKIFYSTQEAVDAIVEHKQTIGFLPLPATIGKQIKILKFNGVYPSAENVQNGTYNLTVPFAVVYKSEPKGLAKKFIEFLFSKQTQEIITTSGSVPVK